MGKQKKIVLVDDDRAVLKSLSAFIRLEMKHEVLTFDLPQEALKKLKRMKNIDMIISDFLMPKMDGIQFLREMKDMFPEATRILLTGYADKENAIKAINKANIYYYLEKPWSNEELKLIIENGLEKKDLIAQLKAKIEELSKAQKALIRAERMSAIGQVSSMIVHDLRAPLTIVASGAEMITSGEMSMEKVVEIAQSILNQSDRISDMTTEIVSFAKGKWDVELKQTGIDSSDFRVHFIEPLQEMSDRFGVSFYSDVVYEGVAELDIEKMQRVFNNLFINAVNAAGPNADVGLIAQGDGNLLSIEFKDNGLGIQDEIKDSIFDPFVSYGRKKGVGLGLAICRELVHKHNGEISVSNLPKGGAKFAITLPLKGN